LKSSSTKTKVGSSVDIDVVKITKDNSKIRAKIAIIDFFERYRFMVIFLVNIIVVFFDLV
jgi:hypothetical protein